MDKITKRIAVKALPAVLEQMLNSIVLISSTWIVSDLGSEAILATSWNGVIYNFFMAIFTGLATATTVLIGREFGRQNNTRIKIVLQHSLIIGGSISIAIGILAYFFSGNILALMFGKADPLALSLATNYCKITLALLPLTAFEFIFVGALRGITNNKIPLIAAIIINVLNVVFSYTLINGLIFPSIGLMGAAIGVSLARLIGLAFIVVYTFFYNDIFKGEKIVFKITKTFTGKIFKIGIPSMLEQGIVSGGFMLLATVLVKLSMEQQTAYNISTNLNSISWGPSNGIAVTMVALISKAIGENKDARKYISKSFKLIIFVTLVQGVIFWIAAGPLARAFSDDSEVIKYAIICARSFAALAPVLGFSMVEAGILRGAGRVSYVTVTSFIALWICRVMVVWILLNIFNLDVSAVFIGIFLDFGSKALLYYLKIRKKDCFIEEI